MVLGERRLGFPSVSLPVGTKRRVGVRLGGAHRNCYSYPYSALCSLSHSGPSRILKVSYMQYSGITVGSCKSGDFLIASLSSQSGPTAAKTRPYARSKYWSLWLARGECIIVFMGDTR